VVEKGVVTVLYVDSDGTGHADRRDVLAGGAVARIEVDTNGDRMVDVVQVYQNGAVHRQDEDSDYDGSIDLRFVDGQPQTLVGPIVIDDGALPELGCGRFHRFWRRR
jgi:hypothetical protein